MTHKGLSVVRPDHLKKINTAISEGRLANRDGAILSESLKEALITDDGKIMYPVNDGIPVLLEGASVELNQLD
ncbi:MAG: Trm112 family protein [Proteobacteria bacterium]|nr:Trm112 family protein [Pseudomonadota bacterium]